MNALCSLSPMEPIIPVHILYNIIKIVRINNITLLCCVCQNIYFTLLYNGVGARTDCILVCVLIYRLCVYDNLAQICFSIYVCETIM